MCERHVQRVAPTGNPRVRSYALCTTVVAAQRNLGHGRYNRVCELLRVVRLIQRGGERQHRNEGCVRGRELDIRTLNRVIKHGFGCSSGSPNRVGTNTGLIRKNRLRVIIRHSQFSQALVMRKNDPPDKESPTCCLLRRSPRRGAPSRPKISGRRLSSRPTLNVLSCHSIALRCFPQSCGHGPGCCDHGYS